MAAFATFVSVLCLLPQPLLVRHLIDKTIPSRDVIELVWVLVAMVLLALLSAGVSFVSRIAFFSFQQRALTRLQSDLVDRMLHLPITFFGQKQVGYLIGRVRTDVGMVQQIFSAAVVESVSGVVTLVGGLALVLSLSPRLTLFAAMLLPGYAVVSLALSRRLRSTSVRSMELAALLSQQLKETFSGVSVLKLFGLEKAEIKRVERALGELMRASVDQQVAMSTGVLLMSVLAAVGTTGILGVGGLEVLRGRMTLGTLVAFNAAVVFLMRPAMAAVALHMTLQPVIMATGRIFSLIDELPEEPACPQKLVGPACPVTFEAVGFRYSAASPAVLSDFCLRIGAGERLALVGPSGSGKSTVVKMLGGFISPDAGMLSFNLQPMPGLSRQEIRRRLGVVPQDAFLFDASVLDNITVGDPSAGRVRIQDVCEMVGLGPLIARLPKGLDAQIGESGSLLSAGERQRVALARALLRPAEILVLDEATSALDAESEALILRNIGAGADCRAFVVVSHRISSAEWATRVAFLCDGRVLAEGDHDELLRSCRRYAEFWQESLHDSPVPSGGVAASARLAVP